MFEYSYNSELAYFKLYQPAVDYVVVTPAATLPLSLQEVYDQLRIDSSVPENDTYLTGLIQAVTNFAEGYTRRDFINRTYRAYIDFFPYAGIPVVMYEGRIEIKRSKLQTLNSIQYWSNGVLTTVASSVYYVTDSTDYSSIFVTKGNFWPSDADDRKQAIQINFTAGYGVDETSVPTDLKQAMLQHIAAIYENRGDCMDCAGNLPAIAKQIYDQRRILNVKGGYE